MPETRKYLCLNVLAARRDSLPAELVSVVESRGCEIVDCRIVPAGQQLAAVLLIAGNWSALGKLESALPGVGEQMGLQITYAHTEPAQTASDFRPYAAEIVAPQQTRLLGELMRFFAGQGVRISEVSGQVYDSTYTGAAMCNMHMSLEVPLAQHPQTLRESFMDLCDDLHADGMLDPIKT